jgi:hypothetical protein
MRLVHALGAGLALALAVPAHAQSAHVGGYFRVMARPDLQGGNGALGYWNLYGRLLNERPYGMIDFRFDVLEPQPGSSGTWTSLHTRIEGGAVGNAEPSNGNLGNLRMSQVYMRAGNVGLRDVVWQIGTLEYFFGDLGLYDMRPATVFFNTVGISARYQPEWGELQLGFGDSGFSTLRDYNTLLTPGGTARVRLGKHGEIGVGGEAFIEPQVAGNRNGAYQTPGITYEDYVRGEVAESYLEAFPDLEDFFPDPQPRSAASWNVVGYLGFGNAGPLIWNSTFWNYRRVHPDKKVTEELAGEPIDIYVNDFTDERFEFNLGNEMQLRLVPGILDAAWGTFYGNHWDRDNDIQPSDRDRRVASTVLRLQAYITPTFHFLVENSFASEWSRNGNAYREHADSIFANTNGRPDVRGLEQGDADTRRTWQGKTGVVLNPTGRGIYARPSLRLLYGIQLSNQNNAFGNAFVESIDQYNDFDNVEQHTHHVVAAEAEVWF